MAGLRLYAEIIPPPARVMLLILAAALLAGCELAASGMSSPVLIPHTGSSAPLPAVITPPAGVVIVENHSRASTATLAPTHTLPAPTPGAVTTTAAPAATAQPSATPLPRLLAAQWKQWPALPQVPAGLREVYRRGLAQGNNPRAFSILGDCQSQPEVFMGIYDRDPAHARALPGPLQETVANFAGSFSRYSPTVKDGTTEGALLWVQWNDNKEKKCQRTETPLDCELRVQRPAFVFIHIGTHWEARNRQYLERILDILLERGAVPILVTKADNREKDERVNQNLAALAEERGLPLWNFWATVQHLPDNGLKHGSDMYLSDAAVAIHRLGALEALDAVWRAMRDEPGSR